MFGGLGKYSVGPFDLINLRPINLRTNSTLHESYLLILGSSLLHVLVLGSEQQRTAHATIQTTQEAYNRYHSSRGRMSRRDIHSALYKTREKKVELLSNK